MTENRDIQRPPDKHFQLVTNQWTEPFWKAVSEKRLLCASCAECGQTRMPPTPFCPKCRSKKISWTELSGLGTLYSYTIVWRTTMSSEGASLPYVPAVVELDGAMGARLITNIVDSKLNDLKIGTRVEVTFDYLSNELVVPRFSIVT